ncbi:MULTISPECIES: hypothetical protein [Sutterellaceae]|uniref:hypothetical protein n=1 Tax=Sutterellaceae TaxID=995019 RepID=UPI0024944BC7|nr:hypothetical protein [Turicimonas muris]
MTQFFLSDSELRNTNDWIKKKDQSLTKGTVRIPIWSFFSLMNGLNCNWISAATKRDFQLQLRDCFEEQFGYSNEDSSTVERLVAIDDNYQERLKERLRLLDNPWIANAGPFSEEERVLIGNRYAVGYRLLEIAEQRLSKGKSVLWLCQEFPTLAAQEYPVRIAQLEFGASVLSGYFPVLREGGGYFEFLRAGGKSSGLKIVQLKNRNDIIEDPRQRVNLLIDTLKVVSTSSFDVVFVHLDEGITKAELDNQDKIIETIKEVFMTGKEIYIGLEDYQQGTDSYSFVQAVSSCYKESKESMR